MLLNYVNIKIEPSVFIQVIFKVSGSYVYICSSDHRYVVIELKH